MSIPVQITFKNMQASISVEDEVQKLADKLAAFGNRITNCHVLIEAPHRHHRKGQRYNVRIHISARRARIDVGKAPALLHPAPLHSRKELTPETHPTGRLVAHADLHVAIRDAFDNARRKLQSYFSNQSRAVKAPEHRWSEDIAP